MSPFRTVVMTYNLWADTRWPEREPALRALLRRRAPDVLAVQELRPASRAVVDEELPGHARVHESFDGWEREGNLWWDKRLFAHVEHGAEDIGIAELAGHELRRLFWVRLRPAAEPDTTVVVATAHYAYQGTARETVEHVNPRISQAERTLEVLGRVAPDGACLFMGDLNEHWHTLRILRAGGLTDSFAALGAVQPPTFPTVPTRPGPWAPWVIDFQLHRGPLRPATAEVVEFFHDELAPSDHKPVVTTYAFDG